MTVDFHCHSTASDGTFTPGQLAEKGASFAMMALTDHDNMDGIAEFLSAPGGNRRIAGVELSIEPGEGFNKFHLLALGVNPKDEPFKAFLHRILEGRNARNERIIVNFRRIGIELGHEIASYAHGDVLARPHFARWLVDHHFAHDIPDAFARYLLSDSPKETRCYEERWRPTQEAAFAAVHAAGGITVMAHPKYWCSAWARTGCDFAKAERGLAALREKGLDGVEALYQANTGAENVAFVQMATRFGYLKSAGSDFHGANKPTIPLGMTVSDDYIKPLLERLS